MSQSAQTEGGSQSNLEASTSLFTSLAGPEPTNTVQSTSVSPGRPSWGGGPPPWVTAGWRPSATTIVITSSPSLVSNLAISSSSTASSDSSSIITSSSSSVATTSGQTILSTSAPPLLISSPTTHVIQSISSSTSTSSETEPKTEPKTTINKPALAFGITAGIILIVLLLLLAFWYGRRRSSKKSHDGLGKQEMGSVESEGVKSIEIGNSVMLGSTRNVEMEGRRSPVELEGKIVPVEVYGGEVRKEYRKEVGIGVWLKGVGPTEVDVDGGGDVEKGSERASEVGALSNLEKYS